MSVVFSAQLLLVPPSPSSQVMNTAVLPLWYSALLKMVGRLLASQLSPSWMVPSCMSSIRFGVTNENAGSALAARSELSCGYGTSSVEHPDRVEKYGGGLWRTAYSPEFA